MKRNISSSAVALLLVSLMLVSSLTFTSNLIYAQGGNITFTTGSTMDFTSTITMTFQPETMSFQFGTGFRILFEENPPDGVLQPCDYIQILQPPGYIPLECSWWEVFDPLTGQPIGEIHFDGLMPPHIDMVYPGQIIVPIGSMIWAEMKIPSVKPCDTFVVHEPTHWWPSPCTWWMFIDPETLQRFDFHVDWTNESCEFHIDKITPEPFLPMFPLYELDANSIGQIDEIHNCNWFEVLDPQGFTPTPCSWWEILDPTGAPTGYEFHVDSTEDGKFHVDQVTPDPIVIPWGPTTTITVRQKISEVSQCQWFQVNDLLQIPYAGSWWRIITPDIGDVEFYIDIVNPDGTFHVDTAIPVGVFDPPVYMVTAERKIDDIMQCDWFTIVPLSPLPDPGSWWNIITPVEWTGIKFYVDTNDGINRFHVDGVDGQLTPITPWPYSVTAEPYEPQPPAWYVKPPYPDYAPSGMPDFDQKQDMWGPGQGIFTWCGPVSVANSLWWLDSEYESIYNPAPVPPPTISDYFPLVLSYNPQVWDDHDPLNVDLLTRNLAFLMDTDGQMSGDGHTGTRWQDMVNGIQTYLMQQGVAGMFEVHFGEFPEFGWIEYEIERCQDVVLFLEFYQFVGDWIPLYDNPSLEFGHFVTCAGVNSTTLELLISDPYQDAYESGADPNGRSPVPHVYPHPSQVHNDAQYVSQDAYGVQLVPSPYGFPVWELVGYLQTMGYNPSWHAFIRTAVITSPTGIHDVAVTDILTHGHYLSDLVNRGDTSNRVYVNVTVENQGTFPETFDVYAYASNATKLEIGKQTITLDPATQTILKFLWSTAGYKPGNYTISAEADLPSDMDPGDNIKIDGQVLVKLLGDLGTGPPPQFFKFDKKVDASDTALFIKCYKGTAPPEYKWLGDLGSGPPPLFFKYDNKVDASDTALFIKCYKGLGP